jgi:hypothetical protein
MYEFSSGELYVHRINGIFSRCTNLSKLGNTSKDFSNMYNRGFRFYKSKDNRKILSSEDILRSFFDVMNIESRMPVKKT